MLMLLLLLALMLVAWFLSMSAGAQVIEAKTPQLRREMWPLVLLSLTIQLIVVVVAVIMR